MSEFCPSLCCHMTSFHLCNLPPSLNTHRPQLGKSPTLRHTSSLPSFLSQFSTSFPTTTTPIPQDSLSPYYHPAALSNNNVASTARPLCPIWRTPTFPHRSLTFLLNTGSSVAFFTPSRHHNTLPTQTKPQFSLERCDPGVPFQMKVPTALLEGNSTYGPKIVYCPLLSSTAGLAAHFLVPKTQTIKTISSTHANPPSSSSSSLSSASSFSSSAMPFESSCLTSPSALQSNLRHLPPFVLMQLYLLATTTVSSQSTIESSLPVSNAAISSAGPHKKPSSKKFNGGGLAMTNHVPSPPSTTTLIETVASWMSKMPPLSNTSSHPIQQRIFLDILPISVTPVPPPIIALEIASFNPPLVITPTCTVDNISAIMTTTFTVIFVQYQTDSGLPTQYSPLAWFPTPPGASSLALQSFHPVDIPSGPPDEQRRLLLSLGQLAIAGNAGVYLYTINACYNMQITPLESQENNSCQWSSLFQSQGVFPTSQSPTSTPAHNSNTHPYNPPNPNNSSSSPSPSTPSTLLSSQLLVDFTSRFLSSLASSSVLCECPPPINLPRGQLSGQIIMVGHIVQTLCCTSVSFALSSSAVAPSSSSSSSSSSLSPNHTDNISTIMLSILTMDRRCVIVDIGHLFCPIMLHNRYINTHYQRHLASTSTSKGSAAAAGNTTRHVSSFLPFEYSLSSDSPPLVLSFSTTNTRPSLPLSVLAQPLSESHLLTSNLQLPAAASLQGATSSHKKHLAFFSSVDLSANDQNPETSQPKQPTSVVPMTYTVLATQPAINIVTSREHHESSASSTNPVRLQQNLGSQQQHHQQQPPAQTNSTPSAHPTESALSQHTQTQHQPGLPPFQPPTLSFSSAASTSYAIQAIKSTVWVKFNPVTRSAILFVMIVYVSGALAYWSSDISSLLDSPPISNAFTRASNTRTRLGAVCDQVCQKAPIYDLFTGVILSISSPPPSSSPSSQDNIENCLAALPSTASASCGPMTIPSLSDGNPGHSINHPQSIILLPVLIAQSQLHTYSIPHLTCLPFFSHALISTTLPELPEQPHNNLLLPSHVNDLFNSPLIPTVPLFSQMTRLQNILTQYGLNNVFSSVVSSQAHDASSPSQITTTELDLSVSSSRPSRQLSAQDALDIAFHLIHPYLISFPLEYHSISIIDLTVMFTTWRRLFFDCFPQRRFIWSPLSNNGQRNAAVDSPHFQLTSQIEPVPVISSVSQATNLSFPSSSSAQQFNPATSSLVPRLITSQILSSTPPLLLHVCLLPVPFRLWADTSPLSTNGEQLDSQNWSMDQKPRQEFVLRPFIIISRCSSHATSNLPQQPNINHDDDFSNAILFVLSCLAHQPQPFLASKHPPTPSQSPIICVWPIPTHAEVLGCSLAQNNDLSCTLVILLSNAQFLSCEIELSHQDSSDSIERCDICPLIAASPHHNTTMQSMSQLTCCCGLLE